MRIRKPVIADTRWIGPHGIGRFAAEVLARVPHRPLRLGLPLLHPLEPIHISLKLRGERGAVYFTPGFNPPIWSPLPVVFTVHDLIHLKIPEETSLNKRLYYETVIRRALQGAAWILTVSEFSKGEILAWARIPDQRVVVVGNGVGGAFVPEGPRYDPGFPYLLHVGSHKPHKNLARLLEALKRVPKDVRLLLSGPPDPVTVRHVERLALSGRVVFCGLIPEAELPAYYRGALALMIPSLYEGFGLPALEAMACGTPVLASNVTALPEVIGDAGLFVDPHDVESIAEGIRWLVDDSALRERLRMKGLERARQFSWERTTQLVWQVIQEASES